MGGVGGLKLPNLSLMKNNVMFGLVLLTSTSSPTVITQKKCGGGGGRTDSELTKNSSCGLQKMNKLTMKNELYICEVMLFR